MSSYARILFSVPSALCNASLLDIVILDASASTVVIQTKFHVQGSCLLADPRIDAHTKGLNPNPAGAPVELVHNSGGMVGFRAKTFPLSLSLILNAEISFGPRGTVCARPFALG